MAEFWRPRPRNLRLASSRYRDTERPVFVTIRATDGRVPFRHPALNDDVIGNLREVRIQAGCLVYAYCLMPDHFHMVTAPRSERADVRRFVDRFKSVSTRLAWAHGHVGRLWQPRFYDHVIRTEESLVALCEYVIMNPVNARLVENEDDYRWSGQLDLWEP